MRLRCFDTAGLAYSNTAATILCDLFGVSWRTG